MSATQINSNIFEIDGERFYGNFEQLQNLYNQLNPSKKFRIWLIDCNHKVY